MKDRFTKYIDITLPDDRCNFRCHYCYVAQMRAGGSRTDGIKFKYSPEHVAAGLSRKRLGGGGAAICNICGYGETLITDYAGRLALALLKEGHFVIIVSNGTLSASITKLIEVIPAGLRPRLMVKFSFHYLELKRQKLFDTYWKNVKAVRDSKMAICLEMCPSDELMPFVDDIKKMCLKNAGALPQVTNARDQNTDGLRLLTKLSLEEYARFWSQFDSPMFDLKIDSYAEKRKEFCYSGLWAAYVNAGTGYMFSCHSGDTIGTDVFADITKPIKFKTVRKCRAPYCVNAHCGMAMGCLPDVECADFCAMRDRVCADGSHWLTREWIDFASQKLYGNNLRYPKLLEKLLSAKHRHSLWWHLRHFKF